MLQTHICVQMSRASQTVRIYQDGKFAQEKTSSANINVDDSGALLFGQEQDKINGGFDANQAFR